MTGFYELVLGASVLESDKKQPHIYTCFAELISPSPKTRAAKSAQ